MAKRKSSTSSRRSRSSSQRKQKQEQYDDYSIVDPNDIPDGPDVLVDVPVVKVDKIDIEVDDLRAQVAVRAEVRELVQLDRKSTRLNSSHLVISYAVFCLKKKKCKQT